MHFDLGPDLTRPEYGDLSVLAHVMERRPFGHALEFGVATGKSLALIAAQMPVIGFDSFEGLPEDWRPGFPAGKFAQAQVPEVEGAELVVGLFSDTLPTMEWPDEVGLIHLDADLYSSTITALTYTLHLLQPGTYLVFDEFHGYPGCEEHEQRAWWEFSNIHNIDYRVIGHGREQWAIQIW